MIHSLIWLCLAITLTTATVNYTAYPEVLRFQRYIRINTTTGNDLTPAVAFWKELAAAQNVTFTQLELVKGYSVLILEWPGTNSSLQSFIVNSHMDVVPANEADGWTMPPFGANITSDGVIWGRGTQDNKCDGLAYYEALSRLKAKGVKLARTVYMTLMPDEEVGGENGMVQFLKSSQFKKLNVGFELDEGAPFPTSYIPMIYHDKAVWQIRVDCNGTATHGSFFPLTNETATGQCRNFINTLLAFRDEQYKIYLKSNITDASAYTSVNLNKMSGGTANNVIPAKISLVFDIRLATNVSTVKFANQLSSWVAAAGANISLTYILKNPQSPATVITDKNPYWTAINKVAKSLNLTITPFVPPGSTDARFVRRYGIPAFGITPMPNTELLVHMVNERLNLSTYMNTINIYESLIKTIGNLAVPTADVNCSIYLDNVTVT